MSDVDQPSSPAVTNLEPERGSAARAVIAAALQASEIRFRRLFETAKDGILILDADTGEVVAANPFLAELTGYSTPEIVGRKIWELGPFNDVMASRVAFSELQANEFIRYDDLPLRARDGRAIDVEFVSNVYEAAGKKVIQCNIRDISWRKRSAASEQRLVAILEATPDLVGIADSDGRLVYMNRGGRAMVGMTEDQELTGYKLRDLYGIVDRRLIVEQAIPTALKIGTWTGHTSIVARNGRSTPVSQVVLAHMGRGGELAFTSVTARDITEPTRVARELEASEARMRLALLSAGAGIWDLDHATGVLRLSSETEAQYGLSPGTFAGTVEGLVALTLPEDRDALARAIAEAMRVGGPFVLKGRTRWPDGSVHWLEGTGHEYHDTEGRPHHALGISRDVSAAHLLEEQYRQAQKMEAVGQLASGVAHDFNNLLSAMLGYSELLMSSFEPTDPRYADLIEIQKAGLRAATLTRQLLTFSHKQTAVSTAVDVNNVVSGMRDLLQRLIGENVRIVLDLAPELAAVTADRTQMEQVVMNLAVNARDAMPQGGTLTIGTANVELDADYAASHVGVRPGAYVSLTVRDTGTGMPPHVLAHLFEPFFTTKEVGRGTGLGLATVHGIVTEGGGSVTVHSELGRGTLFIVHLPARTLGAATKLATAHKCVDRATNTETILVVEDEPGLRELVGRLLRREGYTVLLAADAEQAARAFARDASIQLLLTDVVMAGANGPELARRLLAQRPTLKVIYMSGYAEDITDRHGAHDSEIDLLHKPFTHATLARTMRDVLDR